MIVWQGAGFLGALIPVIFVLAGNYGLDKYLGTGYYSSHSWAPMSMLLASALVVWLFGKRLANIPGRELIDPNTQERFIFKTRHTIFWMPLHYFAGVLVVFAIALPLIK